MDTTSIKFELIAKTLQEPNNHLSVTDLCSIAGVSRSGYYNWLSAAPTREARERQDQADFELIVKAYQFRGYDKGIRGVHMRLLHLDPPVVMNIKKIQRLMRKYNLSCPIRKANPYRRMAKSLRTNAVAENLLQREFEAHGPRKVLLTDIPTFLMLADSATFLPSWMPIPNKSYHMFSASLWRSILFLLLSNSLWPFMVSICLPKR